MKTTLILTGAFAGQTVRLGHHQFVEGKLVLEGASHEVDSAIKVLGRGYQAFMPGSDELESAQKRDALVKAEKDKADGILSGTDKTGKPGNTDGLPSDAHGTSGPVQDVRAIPSGDSRVAPAGDEGMVSSGSGPQSTGLDNAQVKKIKDALLALDAKADSDWAENGLPSIEALTKATGNQSITRAMVDAVAPKYDRIKASDI